MPTTLIAWRPVFVALGVLLVLLSTGAAMINWQLAAVDARLEERLERFNKTVDEIYKRIERLEDRINK